MSLLPGKRITDWVIAAGTLLTVATLIGGGIVYAVRLRDDASASMRSDVDHESRLRVIESVVSDVRADVRETKTDVSWIRTFLDPHRQPGKVKDAPQTAANEP
jgi:hypothetical protein